MFIAWWGQSYLRWHQKLSTPKVFSATPMLTFWRACPYGRPARSCARRRRGLLFPNTGPLMRVPILWCFCPMLCSLFVMRAFELLDCDCTVAAQAPRLLPHRALWETAAAEVMGVTSDKEVGVKATTITALWALQEGIAAWAVVLLGRSAISTAQPYDRLPPPL